MYQIVMNKLIRCVLRWDTSVQLQCRRMACKLGSSVAVLYYCELACLSRTASGSKSHQWTAAEGGWIIAYYSSLALKPIFMDINEFWISIATCSSYKERNVYGQDFPEVYAIAVESLTTLLSYLWIGPLRSDSQIASDYAIWLGKQDPDEQVLLSHTIRGTHTLSMVVVIGNGVCSQARLDWVLACRIFCDGSWWSMYVSTKCHLGFYSHSGLASLVICLQWSLWVIRRFLVRWSTNWTDREWYGAWKFAKVWVILGWAPRVAWIQ